MRTRAAHGTCTQVAGLWYALREVQLKLPALLDCSGTLVVLLAWSAGGMACEEHGARASSLARLWIVVVEGGDTCESVGTTASA